MTSIYFILLCVLVGLSALLFILAFSGGEEKKERYAERLKKVDATTASRSTLRDEEKMNKSLAERILLPLGDRLSRQFAFLVPTKTVEAYDQAILEAGMGGKVSGAQLTAISYLLMATFGGFMLFMGSLAILQGTEVPGFGRVGFPHVMIVFALCVTLGYRLPYGIIAGKAKKRKYEIQRALPFTFDLISISVEAGMAFDGAMATVSERTTGALSEEMKQTLYQINLGMTRQDALSDLGKRTGVEDLQSFITAVNYISKLGGSLVEVIRIQTEAMRVKRRQRAEKLAAQAPVKIMIPLVLFILPCVFIIVLGPPFLAASKTMLQMH